MKRLIAATFLIFSLVTGCGGGGGGGGGGAGTGAPAPAASPAASPALPLSTETTLFWAYDLVSNAPYQLSAAKVGEGISCSVYLESGATVSAAAVAAIVSQFDSTIYPNVTAAFGPVPSPGVDGDPKVVLLLLNIRDGFASGSSSYVAGYFDPFNEYDPSQVPTSNKREMIYMNVNPATGIVPGGAEFGATLAHELQHVIHWEQKTRRQGLQDDAWLDEAMATVAPTYCGYGTDWDRVRTFELAPATSLTRWEGSIENYGVVYMWAQYLKDQLGGGIFRRMLENAQTGIGSVNGALAAVGYPWDFSGVFRNWAVANASGNAVTWLGHPEWSYTSVDTRSGNFGGVPLPGLLNRARLNAATLQPLDPWSVGYYAYTPGSSTTGTVTWTPAGAEKASFYDAGGGLVVYDLAPGASTSFTTRGYLIVQNPSGTDFSSSATVARTSQDPVATPGELVAAMELSPLARSMSVQTGQPQHVCIGSALKAREKALRAAGTRPEFR